MIVILIYLFSLSTDKNSDNRLDSVELEALFYNEVILP